MVPYKICTRLSSQVVSFLGVRSPGAGHGATDRSADHTNAEIQDDKEENQQDDGSRDSFQQSHKNVYLIEWLGAQKLPASA